MINPRSTLLFIGSAFAIGGCAPDRDLDAYRRDQEREDRVRAQRLVGVYSGEVVRSQGTAVAADKEVLGPMGLQISTTTRPTDFNAPQSVLTGELVFLGATSIPISFTNGSYDPDENSFVMTFDVRGPGDGGTMTQTHTLSLEARGEGDTLVGTISVLGDTAAGKGSFVLTKRPEAKSASGYLTNEGIEGNPVEAINAHYTGNATGARMDFEATMTLENQSGSIPPAVRFANLFQRQKTVRASVRLVRNRAGQDPYPIDFTFELAGWDTTDGRIEAVQTRGGVGGSSSEKLSCSPKNKVEPLGALTCRLVVSGEKTSTIDITLNPVVRE